MKTKELTTLEQSKLNLKGKTLDELLEEITVCDEWENESSKSLEGWFAVVTDLGIVAYFGSEQDAFRFRLDYINLILNS